MQLGTGSPGCNDAFKLKFEPGTCKAILFIHLPTQLSSSSEPLQSNDSEAYGPIFGNLEGKSASLQLGRLAASIQAEVLKRVTSDRSDVEAPTVASLTPILSFVKAQNRSRDGSNPFLVLTNGLEKDFSASSLQVSMSPKLLTTATMRQADFSGATMLILVSECI